jgi:GR25 family glycosyltransferase involved in LPS biosynthesis
METIITIPTVQGLRIKHVKALHELHNFDEKNPFRHYCKIVSILSGRSMQYIYTRCDARDVVDAYNTAMKVFEQLNNELARNHKKPLPNEINISGKDYELVNLDRPNVSFIIDSDMSDFEKDPVRLACMCYIPKGTVYGEMDDAENVLHPIQYRHEAFSEEFPLFLYLRLHAFFLRKYHKSASVYMVSQKVTRKLNKAASMIGFYRLTSWLKRLTQLGAKSSN